MHPRHVQHVRVVGVLRALSVSRSVRRAGAREACLWSNRAVNALPVKAAGRRIRTHSAGFVMVVAGPTPGKYRKGCQK